MTKKKACRQCRVFVKGNECHLCKSTDFTTSWKGRVIILNPELSEVAKKMGAKEKGEYAIKIK